MFYHSLDDGTLIVGVCDGHGPFGHIVSFRLVQTLPHFIVTNSKFGTRKCIYRICKVFSSCWFGPLIIYWSAFSPWWWMILLLGAERMQECFEEAFQEAQKELHAFSDREGVDFAVSGSTATVLVRQEQKIHVAWVGDSCIFQKIIQVPKIMLFFFHLV